MIFKNKYKMATKFTKKELEELPKYVRFGNNIECSMRLYNPEKANRWFMWKNDIAEYYRDAGAWSVDIRIDKVTGKVYSVCNCQDTPWLHNVELIPTTYDDWKKDNEGYLDKGDKAFYS